MKEIKALWLCSWYPDIMQPQNGDFIQRHATATSLYSKVVTIHVAPCTPLYLENKKYDLKQNKVGNLEENILYYAKSNEKLVSKVRSVFTYFRVYKEWIDHYIHQNGKPDIVHLNVTMRDGVIALYIRKKYNISYVISEHWSVFIENNGKVFNKRSYLFKWLSKRILKNAENVLPVSNHLGMALKKITNLKSLQPIANVVDTNRFKYVPNKTDAFRFIHISSFHVVKNINGILQAFTKTRKKHPTVELIMVGAPAENIASIEGVSFVTNIPYNEVPFYLQSANSFVLFSDVESQPCVLLEAMCCGIPIISTNVGGIPEIINQQNGLLVEPRNVEMLAEKMSYMIQNIHKYDREKISKIAIQHCSYQEIGFQINNVYKNVLASKK